MIKICSPLLCPLVVLDREFLSGSVSNLYALPVPRRQACGPCLPLCASPLTKLILLISCFASAQRDDVATQFTQMNLSRQSSGVTPEPPSGPVYPASLMPQPAQQPSYVIASTGQQLPAGGFSGSGPSISQQVLQAPPSPQGFVQQPPPAQVSVCLFSLTPATYS